MNPLDLIALKHRVGHEHADQQALPILIYFDAAARGQGNATAENALVRLVVIAQCIGSKSGNRAFYDTACAAGAALFSAAGRGRELLAFTTGEHKAMRKMVNAYLRVLPTLEVAMLVVCCQRADEIIKRMQNQDAAA